MNRFSILTALLAGALALPAAAQSPNPRGAVSADVGSASISIDYGRPDLGDRMLGDLLDMLTEDRVWRAGENQVSTLETSAAVKIGNETIPAGRYSLYLHVPESGNWHLLVNRHLGIALGELWSEAPEAMRAEPWPMLTGYAGIAEQEQARIQLDEGSASGDGKVFEIMAGDGMIHFSWGGTAYQTTLQAP